MAVDSKLVDRVKIIALSSGAGAFQLGAAARAYRGVEALQDGLQYSYAVENGALFEAGVGEYLQSLGRLTRNPVVSSNGGTAVDFPVNVEVAFTALAQDLSVVSARKDAVLAAGFATWATLVVFAPQMQDGDLTTVSIEDDGTHADAGLGHDVPNGGVYQKTSGFDLPLRLRDLESQDAASSANLAYSYALLLSTTLAAGKEDSLAAGQANPDIAVGEIFLVIEDETGRIYWGQKGTTESVLIAEYATKGSSVFATRTAMAALPDPVVGQVFYLFEAGRQGFFEVRSGDAPGGDTLQGLTVQSGTAGRHFARVWDGIHGDPRWFGAVTGVTSGGQPAANLLALQACYVNCPVTSLPNAAIYTSDTWVLATAHRVVEGVTFAIEDLTGTRIVCTDASKSVIRIGGTGASDLRTGIFVRRVCAMWSVNLVPPLVSAANTAVRAFDIQWNLAGDFEYLFALNALVGIYAHGNVNTKVRLHGLTRTVLYSGGNPDFAIGVLAGGPKFGSFVGGNASLFLDDGNTTLTGAATALTKSWAAIVWGDIADTFIRGLESSQVRDPVVIDGSDRYGVGGVAGTYGGDVQVRLTACDNFQGDGVLVDNLPPQSLIMLTGGFLHINDTGGSNAALRLAGGNGQISVTNMQIHGENSSTTSIGIVADGQPNLHVASSVEIQNIAFGVQLYNCPRPDVRPQINAGDCDSLGTRAACSVTNCQTGNVSPRVSGPANAWSQGVLVDNISTRIEISATGLDGDAIDDDVVKIGTHSITAPGFYKSDGTGGAETDKGILITGFVG